MLENAVLGADFVLHEMPYQKVEVLQGFEDQPYKEIAATLGISAGAVKLRVFRALRLLRTKLKQQGIKP